MRNKIILALMVLFLGAGVTIENSDKAKDMVVGGFSNMRGFTTLQSSTATQVAYQFGVVDIPIERAGAASSSTGFEFGKALPTSVTAETYASTSAGFAITMNESGKVKGCAFDLNAASTTGTVSVQIQKNGTLQTGKYCKLPRSGTFATAGSGGIDDLSTSETITDEITFVAGDRLGLIASSSELSAATFDGFAQLLIQINN